MDRLRLFLLFAIASSCVGCQTTDAAKAVKTGDAAAKSTPTFVGTYELVTIQSGKRVDRRTLPPAALAILEIRADKTWDIRSILSGWSGTWEEKAGRLHLTELTSPSGKSEKPAERVLERAANHSTLVPVSPKEMVGKIEYVFDPDIVKKINDQIMKAMEKADVPK